MCNTTKGCCPSTSQIILAIINFISFLINFLLFISATCLYIIPSEDIYEFFLKITEADIDTKQVLEHIFELIALDKFFLTAMIFLAVTMSLSLFGFIASVTGNRCFLITYMIMSSLVLLIHSGLFIAFFFNMNFIFEGFLKNRLNKSAYILLNQDDNNSKNDVICGFFHKMSEIVECCGVEGISDFQNKTFFSVDNNKTIDALECCSSNHTKGCASEIVEQIAEYKSTVVVIDEYIIANSLMLFFQLCLILLAVLVFFGVFKRFQRKKEIKEDIEELNEIRQRQEQEYEQQNTRPMRGVRRV